MKYLAKSAEVLSEADRFQKILDWELFTSTQDIQLNHSHIDGVTWRPGMPIYPHPRELGLHCDCDECIAEYRETYGDHMGNHVRPLLELLEDGDTHYPQTCCDVSWDRYVEANCWVCGKEFPLLERKKSIGELMRGIYPPPPVHPLEPIDLQRALNTPGGFSLGFIESTTEDENGLVISMRLNTWAQDMFNQMRRAADEAEAGFRRMYIAMNRRNGLSNFRSIMDEYIAFDIETTNRFYADSYSYHNPIINETNVFERPNIRGPIWGWAALYDPLTTEEASYNFTRFVNGFLLPGWQNYQPEIPTFQLLEPRDWSTWEPNGQTGPPTTLNRRRREV